MRRRVSASSSRHLQACRRAGVRHPAAAAARTRADDDPASLRQPLAPGDEAGGDVDHLADVAALDDAVTLEHRLIGRVGAGQRRRMRRGRPHASVRLADLIDDDGLAGPQRLLGHAPERLRRLDVLQQQHQRVGLALVENELGEVERLQARLVAGGDDVAERQLLGAPVIEEGEADAAALRGNRNLRRAGAPPGPGACRRPPWLG